MPARASARLSNRNLRALACVLFLVIGASLSARADYLIAHVVAVHDGDTISVRIGGPAGVAYAGRIQRVRLNGIDAPELAQPFGKESGDLLRAAVLDKDIILLSSKIDRYGRIVAKVICHGVDENELQLKAGAAWFYRQYQRDLSPGDRIGYAAAELDAHNAHRGLWSNESPEAPWTFRRNKKASP